MTAWFLGVGNGYIEPISTSECGMSKLDQLESDDLMSGLVPYSMLRHPYSCNGSVTLIVHKLAGNRGNIQHS